MHLEMRISWGKHPFKTPPSRANMGGEGSNLEGKVVMLREVPTPACFLGVLSRPCGPQSWLHRREEAGLPHTGSGPGHTEDCPRSTAGMHRPGGGGAGLGGSLVRGEWCRRRWERWVAEGADLGLNGVLWRARKIPILFLNYFGN